MSEFRQDLISGDWVLIAPERARKPDAHQKDDFIQLKEDCPFEDFKKPGNEIIWSLPEGNEWHVALLKNKFPAVNSGACAPMSTMGFFNTHEGVGEHNLFIFKEHGKPLADFGPEEMLSTVRAYKRRYQEITKAEEGGCGKYIMIFNNYGLRAGASVYHPHTQLISIPVVPPAISRRIQIADDFYKKNGEKVYTALLNWEKKGGKRIVYENEKFVVLCPFASKHPYETKIIPKSGESNFADLPEEDESYFADALSRSLKAVKISLNDPSYNFYIHSAPIDSDSKELSRSFTWHLELLPKLYMMAGFEIGTGVDINVIDPDDAANLLRKNV